VRPEARGDAPSHDLDDASQRVAGGLGRVDPRDHLALGLGVEAAHGAAIGGGVQGSGERGAGPGGHPPDLRDVAADLDTEVAEQELAHGAARDARGGLPRAGALEDVAGVAPVVFLHPGQIRVTRPRPGHLAPALGAGRAFGGHDVLPVLPVAVPDDHRDGRAQGLARPDPSEPFDAVGLDLHARAAPVAGHAASQLGVDAVGAHRESGGQALEDRQQGATVRFTGGRES